MNITQFPSFTWTQSSLEGMRIFKLRKLSLLNIDLKSWLALPRYSGNSKKYLLLTVGDQRDNPEVTPENNVTGKAIKAAAQSIKLSTRIGPLFYQARHIYKACVLHSRSRSGFTEELTIHSSEWYKEKGSFCLPVLPAQGHQATWMTLVS